MPNSDTWPRAVSMEPLSNMDSAGSYDSVISVNSACSEDSMEHLSAEERACLMYLEETIESLDVQEDSGFSNDEPDSAILRLKHGGLEIPPESGPCSNILTVLAEGGRLAGTTDVSCNVEHKTENPTLVPQLASSSTPNTSDTKVHSHIPSDPMPAAAESTSGSATPVPELSLSTEGHPPSVAALSSKASSEMDISLIPPPSDFMDEPVPVPAPPPQVNNEKPPATSTTGKKPTIDLELLRRRVSEKKAPVNTPVSPAPQDKFTSELYASQASSPSSPQSGAPPVAAEPKSPPSVAPKPKKLPANIILKPHKSVGGYENSMGHPVLMDPQRVRMEALRKLGLLKSEEGDSGPALSPKPSSQTRRSWAPSSSPLSSPPPKSESLLTPNTCSVNSSSPDHTSVPPSMQTVVGQSFTPTLPSTLHIQSEVLPDIIPVPAAFSDPVEPLHDSVFVGVSESVVSDQGHLEPFSSPVLDKKPVVGGVKSATLERSGLGLSSYMESLEQQTLGQLRNSRPRPASLGSGKDFSSAHRGVAHTSSKDPDSQKCVPAPSHHSDSSQKLPRSQGISVLICPRAQSEEARREALKKLGLLRD